jgi:hypothetical protein
MKQFRKAILWTVLAAIFLLMVLSAIGALIGVDKARGLFNSPPTIAFWFLTILLLAAGFAAFRRLIVAPAGLAMHLGAILIIAGAMWGSEKAHELRKAWLDDPKVQSGTMPIMEGQSENNIYNSQHEAIATLPFGLYLKDFSIDYHPPREKEWMLIVVAPVVDQEGHVALGQERLDWKIGQEIQIAHTDVSVKVLQYLDRARRTGPTGAAEDPSSQTPAMELQLTHEGRTRHEWLLPEPGAQAARLSLAPLVAGSAEVHSMERMMAPKLYLVQPRGEIQSYKSDVTIFEDNRKVGEAVIEVNHPLHWGGYSFYQSSYDAEREAYTVLSVVSDSGLMAVYLGMAILSIGAFWRFWGEAVWGYTRKKMLNVK